MDAPVLLLKLINGFNGVGLNGEQAPYLIVVGPRVSYYTPYYDLDHYIGQEEADECRFDD